MTARVRLAALATAALLATGFTAPVMAQPAPTPATDSSSDTPSEPEPAATPTADPSDAPEPDAAAPVPPTISAVTPTTDTLQVAWEWPDPGMAPEGVTSVIVRAMPGDHEVVVPATETTAALQDLEPDTAYSVTVLATAGEEVGDPSEPLDVQTLALIDTGSDLVDEASMKPMASPGDVDRLIVTLKDDVATETRAAEASDDLPVAGVVVEDTQDIGEGSAVIELDEGVSESDAAVIAAEISSDPNVESVEVDRRMRLAAFPVDPPDDPYWTGGSMWGLYGTYGIGIGSAKTSMSSVWTATASSQGSGTVVAVLDTGSTVHPDLDANYVAGYDFVSGGSSTCRSGATSFDGDYVDTATYGALGWDSNPLDPGDWTTEAYCYGPSDSSWHGTHVAGTIAAVGNNSTGVIGVAPQARIQPVRVLSMDGGWTSDIAAAITWASGGSVSGVPANATPADVINLSLGGSGSCSSTFQTAIDGAVGRGSVVVVSAGNSTANASGYSPASCNNVITVAASTSSGTLASYSNYGSTVEITAPGSGIWSTLNSGSQQPGSASYASYSGTSMAAPHVSGVAALLRAADASRTPAQILTLIQSQALGFPTTGSMYDCTTSICGSGLLRAAAVTTPVIYSVSDATGPVTGGESVTLTGINMATASGVTFGGTSATITAQTATTVTVTTPAHASGAVDIVVTNPDGTGTSSGGYRYFEAPAATSIDTASGSTAGGDFVTISGTDFAHADVQDSRWIDVSFGGSSGTVWLVSPTSVTVATPANSAGTVDVVVTTPGGSSTLANAFTHVTPAPAPSSGGGGGGSSSSSSSSSSESDAGGGGGGLNEITTIAPAASGAPGSVIALAGWGLSTTRGVYFNDYPAASWKVVSDSHVEVVVPDIPPGVYVIHDVLAPEVGRASFWEGFHVLPRSAATPVTGTPPALGTTPGTAPAAPSTSSAADLVGFRPNSSALSASTRTKLTRMTKKLGSGEATGTVLVFSDKRGTAKSKKVARARAKNVVSFLRSQGVEGEIRTIMEKGSTRTLRKSAVVRLSTDPGASTVTTGERVNSLIVRYAKGVSPTQNGAVRGSADVTGGLGTGMTLGPNLGLRMYRVDFASPVTLAQADRAAAQMMTDKGVQFAEPDRIVRATITAN